AQAEQALLERRMVDADVRLLIEEALTHLPTDQRRALDLIYTGGLTFAGTAPALPGPAGTLKSPVHAAPLTLRSFFRRPGTTCPIRRWIGWRRMRTRGLTPPGVCFWKLILPSAQRARPQ